MCSFLKSHKLWFYMTGQHKALKLKEVKLLMPMFFAIGMTPTIKLSLGFATPLLLLFTLNLEDTTRDIQTWPKLENSAKPPNFDLIPTWTKAPVGQWRVFVFRNWHWWVEWWVSFSKTRTTQPNQCNIRNSAKSGKIKLDLVRSRLDLIGFSQIWSNHNKFQQKFANFS